MVEDSNPDAPTPDPGSPPMLVLVDVCNVLHVEGVLPQDLAGVDLGGLADLIARSRFRHDEVVLVMDGPNAGPPLAMGPSRIRAIASGKGRTADEVIIERLERSSSPRSVVVVTSDNAIRRRGRRRRCRLVHSEAFLEQIGHDARLEGRRRSSDVATPPSASTAAWIREFGLDDAAIDRLIAPAATTPQPETDRFDGDDSESAHDDPREPGRVETDPTTDPVGDVDHPRSRRRALEDAKSLEEVDPRELERFDMGEWIDPPSPPNIPDDAT